MAYLTIYQFHSLFVWKALPQRSDREMEIRFAMTKAIPDAVVDFTVGNAV
jgi:hypothetical protein